MSQLTNLMKVVTDRRSKKVRIYTVLKSLELLPKTTVTWVEGRNKILIHNSNEFVPNFLFVWAENRQFYRVYMLVGSREWEKANSGYAICTIPTTLVASGFNTHYAFLHKNRANNKEESF